MGHIDQEDQLFAALTQQLRTPLLQIARLSETQNANALPTICTISEYALLLVDAYVQVHDQQQTKLALEPINTNAVLHDAAAALEPIARICDFEVEIQTLSKGLPVMGHRSTLRTMLALLGASLIDAASIQNSLEQRIILGAHSSEQGIVLGAFSTDNNINQHTVQLARSLYGSAAQTPGLALSGNASLAIADRLSEQLTAPLKTYRHRSLTGIGSLLLPSHQLKLI